jgi:hypothetical protein
MRYPYLSLSTLALALAGCSSMQRSGDNGNSGGTANVRSTMSSGWQSSGTPDYGNQLAPLNSDSGGPVNDRWRGQRGEGGGNPASDTGY